MWAISRISLLFDTFGLAILVESVSVGLLLLDGDGDGRMAEGCKATALDVLLALTLCGGMTAYLVCACLGLEQARDKREHL